MHLCKSATYCVIKKNKLVHSLHTNICLGLRISSGIVPSGTLLKSCTAEIHPCRHSALTDKIQPLHVDVPSSLNLIFIQKFQLASWVRLQKIKCFTTMLIISEKAHHNRGIYIPIGRCQWQQLASKAPEC